MIEAINEKIRICLQTNVEEIAMLEAINELLVVYNQEAGKRSKLPLHTKRHYEEILRFFERIRDSNNDGDRNAAIQAMREFQRDNKASIDALTHEPNPNLVKRLLEWLINTLKSYFPPTTASEGHCFFHAMLGEKNGHEYRMNNVAEYRKKLYDILNQTIEKETNAELSPREQEILRQFHDLNGRACREIFNILCNNDEFMQMLLKTSSIFHHILNDDRRVDQGFNSYPEDSSPIKPKSPDDIILMGMNIDRSEINKLVGLLQKMETAQLKQTAENMSKDLDKNGMANEEVVQAVITIVGDFLEKAILSSSEIRDIVYKEEFYDRFVQTDWSELFKQLAIQEGTLTYPVVVLYDSYYHEHWQQGNNRQDDPARHLTRFIHYDGINNHFYVVGEPLPPVSLANIFKAPSPRSINYSDTSKSPIP